MDLQLQDKVVLVTGGSKGIGEAVVRTFLAEGAQGARKVLARSRPNMTRDQYVSFQRQRAAVLDYDGAEG